jgi:IS605 OrfB family transposase
MNLTIKIKLLTNEEQHNRLLSTMKAFNSACNHISELAFNNKTFSKIKIQQMCYYEIRRDFGLSAQMVIRAIGKVCESYSIKATRKSLHTFKDTGAMVFDDRILSFKGLELASMLTLDGRLEVPMMIAEYHRGTLMGRRIRGQADLILDNNIFYLMLVIELPDKPLFDAEKYIGVDIGIVNIAVDSTGETFSGSKVNNLRKRNAQLRAKLQSKGTKSAKRLLKKRSKKERRFLKKNFSRNFSYSDTNHCISKKIVEKAKALGQGIAIEDLTGIRQRTEKTVRKQQRYRQSSWAFYQLRQFIEYKAQMSGVPVVAVNPMNTSRECPVCGHTDKANRVSRNDFVCQNKEFFSENIPFCGYAAPADYTASINISRRDVVIQPNVGVALSV